MTGRLSIKRSAAGFTIVELMIATAVFSVVLLLATSGLLQITRTYYKGVTEANTQNTARTIIGTVAQAIQFDGGTVQPTNGSNPRTTYDFCVGNTRFRYYLGSELMTSPTSVQTYHALLQDSAAGCTSGADGSSINSSSVSCTTATNCSELVSPNMRLSQFSVTSLGSNLYQIKVTVVYGDDDLLDSPTSTSPNCLGVEAGTQFCAVSKISTTVLKRVE
ncbi:MAG TPA: prepilin-type N-terminal cleavage/methylation domain-containing protein [Candidatus Saccharimonadales bacterium]